MNYSSILLVFVGVTLLGSVAGSAGHDWEFSANLEVDDPSEVYNFVFAKDGETYAASSMKLVVMATTDHGADGVEAVEEDAETLWDGATNAAIYASGTIITPSTSTTYTLTFDENEWVSIFPIQFSSTGDYAFFLEHDPEEFHSDSASPNYLMDSDGHSVAFDYTSTATTTTTTHDDKTNWGTAIGACIIVWLATFAMIVLYGTCSSISVLAETFLKLDLVQMFASGTLLSSAFALIIFESARAVTENTGVASLWMFVTILGFLTASILDGIAHGVIDEHAKQSTADATGVKAIPTSEPATTENENDDAEKGQVVAAKDVDVAPTTGAEDAPQEAKTRTFTEVMQDAVARKTAMTIFIGDFICNYCDGLVVASAFNSCDSTLGWSIATVTVLHELPQELADYAILVDQLKLGFISAALNNLASGFGVLLGAFTIMGTNVGAEAQAYLLAFGAGNFVYLGAVEFFSLAKSKNTGIWDKCEKLLFFMVGVAIIALIARDHAHCDASHSDTATTTTSSDGHNH